MKKFKVIGITENSKTIGIFSTIEKSIDAGENFWKENDKNASYRIETTDGELIMERTADMNYGIGWVDDEDFDRIDFKMNSIDYIYNYFN